ncbi:MAG: ABC transporter substrate-binding protein [Hyphomicrobiaceae bacterium]
MTSRWHCGRVARAGIAAAVCAALFVAVVPLLSGGSGAPLSAGASRAATIAAPKSKPRRIVSLNLCTDQLLVDLADRSAIAALSRLAADPVLSTVAGRVEGMRIVRGRAEEVLALSPDLVVTTAYSTPEAVAMLRRLGVPVLIVPLASDLDGVREAVRLLAAGIGEPERGEQVVRAFDARLAAAAPRETGRPSAIAYQVNSLTSGPGGLLHAALTAAGYRNAAEHMVLGPGARLPLETLVTNPPDLVVLANAPDQFRTPLADNLRHPAFRAILSRGRHVGIDMPLWLCGTPAIADAVERLAVEQPALAVRNTASSSETARRRRGGSDG